MSALPIALLVTTAATGAVGVAVLRTLLALRRQVKALSLQLADAHAALAHGLVPAARTSDTDGIRAGVAEALAEERERELAEARAFWAAQEARDVTDAPSLLGLPDSELFLPRQSDFAGLEAVGLEPVGLEPVGELPSDADELTAGDSPELAAARRPQVVDRHRAVGFGQPLRINRQRAVGAVARRQIERSGIGQTRQISRRLGDERPAVARGA